MHLNPNLPKKILAWYDNNKRSLPWRVGKKSPKKLYYRLLSEFMLQQTQVKTVIPYFDKFTQEFPNLKSISKSSEKKVLKMWEGLGYYRRARNLLLCSKILVKEKNSKLPNNIYDLKKLPGIGDYTANALLALVYNKPTLAIDGNVRRVLSRILNKNEEKINFNKLIEKNDKILFKTKRNSDFVESIMELGALVCKPKDPKCYLCDLKKICQYYKSTKKIKSKVKLKSKSKRYDVFCYLSKNKKIALTKKNNLGFLSKFYLPLIKEPSIKTLNSKWSFLCNYKNSISNKKLKLNVYYKFSNKIPVNFTWYSIRKNKEFIPTFTKKIFKQVETLF
tara:strand:- start:2306 stop:3307 length:1002 start_codon:yes stop_codon:yes gene_type:complete